MRHALCPPLRVRPRALVDSSARGRRPIPLATLAERNALPKFLEQIMATLKHAGIVRTTLGPTAATHRGRPAESRSAGHPPLDGALAPSLRLAPLLRPCSCSDEATCALRDVMLDVRDAMLEILDRRRSPTSPHGRAGRRSTRAASTPTPSPASGPA
jgi:DNA-binding IscR family transcriptional regulator